MLSSSFSSMYIFNVTPDEIDRLILDKGGTFVKETFTHQKDFNFLFPLPAQHKTPSLHTLSEILGRIRRLGKKYKNIHSAGFSVILKKENDTCTFEYIELVSQQSYILSAFPTTQWQDIENELYTYGFKLAFVTEKKTIQYSLESLKATYNVITYPKITPFLEIICPIKKHLPEVVAITGLSIEEVINTNQYEILKESKVDLKNLIFE